MPTESDGGIWARGLSGRITRFGLPVAVLVVLMLAPAQHSLARQPAENNWIGKRVITQYGTVLQVGNRVVDDEDRGKNLARGKEGGAFRIYKVEQANGPWLWLVAEGSGVKGWAPRQRHPLRLGHRPHHRPDPGQPGGREQIHLASQYLE